MESFDAYVGGGDDLSTGSNRPFDNDGYMGFDPRLPSQRFESFHMPEGFSDDHFTPVEEESKDLDDDYKGMNGFDHLGDEAPPPYESAFDDDLAGGQSPGMSSPFGQSFESGRQPDFTPADEFSPTVHSNGQSFGHEEVDGLYGFSQPAPLNGAVLPPPEEMQQEEGFVLREWKRKNAILLEEKARNEREQLSRIIDSADSFKDEFYEKRKNHCETTKTNNREKEKVFLENHVKFHATADQHYWKAVAELIPHELPSMELKSRGGKDKKPTVLINQGPKPGKPTDVTRMRQVLVKLKHNPPAHMKAPPTPPPPAAPAATEASDATPPAAPAPGPLHRQGSAQAVAAEA